MPIAIIAIIAAIPLLSLAIMPPLILANLPLLLLCHYRQLLSPPPDAIIATPVIIFDTLHDALSLISSPEDHHVDRRHHIAARHDYHATTLDIIDIIPLSLHAANVRILSLNTFAG